MKDKNIVILEGIVGNDVKRGTAVNGRKFITFSLCINSFFKDIHDVTESEHSTTYIRVFVYDQRHLKYLNKVKIHQGHRVNIFGRLNSRLREIKGERMIQINVVVRDISVIKKNDDDNINDIDVPVTSDSDDVME